VDGPWAALECVRIPPFRNMGMGSPQQEQQPLDTLGYPLITGSDAHYPEHVGRRPFELDTAEEELLPHGFAGDVDIDALKRALGRRNS